MKRQAIKFLLALLAFLNAGAIINVAVAWTFAFRDPAVVRDSARHFERSEYPKTARQTSIYIAKGEFRVHQISGSRSGFRLDKPAFINESEYQALLPRWSAFNGAEPAVAALKENEDLKFVSYLEAAFGWPMLSLRSTTVFYSGFSGRIYTKSTCLPLPAGLKKSLDRTNLRSELPWRPLPIGFAVNSLSFGMMSWAFVASWAHVRRRIRIKRGQCAVCGYSLRENTSDKCPECGVALIQNRARQEAAA